MVIRVGLGQIKILEMLFSTTVAIGNLTAKPVHIAKELM
jgi:hypothetical protein